jgi:hypothetical protein
MTGLSRRARLALGLARWLGGREALAAISARVDDGGTGWGRLTTRPHDRDMGEQQKLYLDGLEAWRKNPIAKRIVDVITDYTVGDGLRPEAPGDIGRFVKGWWNHPLNNMALRLPVMVDELTRAGDVFVTLHTNSADGQFLVLCYSVYNATNAWH